MGVVLKRADNGKQERGAAASEAGAIVQVIPARCVANALQFCTHGRNFNAEGRGMDGDVCHDANSNAGGSDQDSLPV
jgi:hypothetical protein